MVGLLFILSLISAVYGAKVLELRGGIGPRPADDDTDYYSQFELDYGTEDNKRAAGALRGCNFLPDNLLADYTAKASDPFIKWVYEHLEKGQEEGTDRIKPFYAADFGTKASLKKGQNPKVMILSRKLQGDSQGFLEGPPEDLDVEVREIWQPWLKRKCNFAVRYIIPNRVNIMKIMERKGKFISVAKVEDDAVANKRRTLVEMTFKPSVFGRVFGKRNIVLKQEIDAVSKAKFLDFATPLSNMKSAVEKKLGKSTSD